MTDHSRRRVASHTLTPSEIENEVQREVSIIRAARSTHRLPEARCRVCQDPESRARVNRLLAYGMRINEIAEHIKDLNEKRPKNRQITMESLRNHTERHFNLQDPTNAARRRILQRRQDQLSEEKGYAVATLLTGMGYLDIVAQKGFENLVDEATVVDYETGLKAILKLEEMQREGAVEEQVAQMRRDVSLIQQAVKDVVPPHIMAEISARIDELRGTVKDETIEAEVVDDDDDDDDVGYDPVISSDSNDLMGEN